MDGVKGSRHREEDGCWLAFQAVWWVLARFSSVQFSRSVVSNSLQTHEPQYTRPPCPSPTLRVHPNPCPLSQWCHPTISFSGVPFSSCLQSPNAQNSQIRKPVTLLTDENGQQQKLLCRAWALCLAVCICHLQHSCVVSLSLLCSETKRAYRTESKDVHKPSPSDRKTIWRESDTEG